MVKNSAKPPAGKAVGKAVKDAVKGAVKTPAKGTVKLNNPPAVYDGATGKKMSYEELVAAMRKAAQNPDGNLNINITTEKKPGTRVPEQRR